MVEMFQTNGAVIFWLALTSAITFVGTLMLIPVLVARIPSDYFSHKKRHKAPWPNQHPVVRGILIIGKNLLGYIFIVAGIIMLMLPGQGILTIVVGMTLLDFPGKYRLERWVVFRRPVLRSINWVRRRAKRDPLVIDK